MRNFGDLTPADITPKSVYFNRRQILRAMGLAGAAIAGGKVFSHLAFPPAAVQAGTKLNVALKSPFSTTEKMNSFDDVTHYNNFYEFGTDKGDPATQRRQIPYFPVDRLRRRRSEKARQIQHGRHSEAGSARGAHLPPSLRGRLVHRGSLDRLLAQHHPETRRAHRKSQVRRFPVLL